MNVELAMASLEDAKANPDNFSMDNFFSRLPEEGLIKDAEGFQPPPCGTTACYAGFVSLRVAPVGSKIRNGVVIEPDGTRIHAQEYAQRALGLTGDQTDILFYLNNVEQVERAVTHLASNPAAGYGDIFDAAVHG